MKFFKNMPIFLSLLAIAISSLYGEPNQEVATNLEKNPQKIDVLMVLALPGSGKSEVRKYLASLSKEECMKEYGIGETVQIDDFPYVFFMRKASEEMESIGEEGIFFLSPSLSWKNSKDWGSLMHLIDEDYQDIVAKNHPQVEDASIWLFDRIDRAREKAGMLPAFSTLNEKVRAKLAKALEEEAKKILKSKINQIEAYQEGNTIVIEFARGGAYGSKMPLPSPYGYKFALSLLSPSLLEKSKILYVWVDPEESRRKNVVRANPQDPGSIMHHRVPLTVMYSEYGLDDVDYLLKESKKQNAITIEAHGKKYFVPLGRFDNRVDKTTFLQKDPTEWKNSDIERLKASLHEAFSSIHAVK